MANKYYWLKLKNDFFTQPRIKKLRKIAGGDTYTIIYLKMQLLSLKDDGKLYFEGIEEDFAEEIALTIDEDVENVKITIQFLLAQGLIEQVNQYEYLMAETQTLIGSESSSAQRVRKYREKQKLLQCNTDVTICNTEIEKELEIELDKELDKELDNKKSSTSNKSNLDNEVIITQNSNFENEFEELWKLYPKKQGKKQALKSYIKCRKRKTDQVTFDEVKQGIENYNSYINKKKTEYQYILQGSTYFNQERWNDEYTKEQKELAFANPVFDDVDEEIDF